MYAITNNFMLILNSDKVPNKGFQINTKKPIDVEPNNLSRCTQNSLFNAITTKKKYFFQLPAPKILCLLCVLFVCQADRL